MSIQNFVKTKTSKISGRVGSGGRVGSARITNYYDVLWYVLVISSVSFSVKLFCFSVDLLHNLV